MARRRGTRRCAARRRLPLTFDDLLRKVGVLTSIRVTDDGSWIYQHMVPEPDGLDEQGIQFFFVGDRVTGVSAF